MIPCRPQLRLLSTSLFIACATFTRTGRAQDVLGGIQGSAADSSGAPLAGARVTLVGTAFATSADSTGRYALDHVPAGEYTVRAELSGHALAEVEAILVPAGATVRVDFGPAAQAAPPSLGLTASGALLSGRLLGDLPVDDPRQALVLAPGVVMRVGEIGIADAPELSLRGADLGSASVYIDGAPVRFETLGTDQLALSTNAISQASVVTGIPSPLASDGSGGVISYITRAGGEHLAGSFRATGDDPFPDGSAVGYNRVEGAAGGPLPVVAHLTWFASVALYGQRSAYRGVGAAEQPTYVRGGLDTVVTVNKADGSGVQSVALPQFVQYSGQCAGCQGLRRPMDWSTSLRGQAKLLYSYGAGSSLSVSGITSGLEQRFFPGSYIGDPSLYGGARATSRLAVVNWTQTLRRLSTRPLTFNVNVSLATDDQLSGVLDPASELATRDPALGIELSTLHFTAEDTIPFPLTDQMIRNVRNNPGLLVPYLGRSDLLAAQPYRMNPYGLSAYAGWYTTGLDAGQLLTEIWERRWNGRAFVEWRPGSAQRTSLGMDVERTDLSWYTARLTDQLGLDAFLEHPRRSGLFADYRAEAGHLAIDAGVRYDRFDPGGEFANTPGRITTNPAWSPSAPTSDTAYANSVARVFTPGAAKNALSPRLRLAYGVSARTSVRLGYGQRVAAPPFELLFRNVNSDLAFTAVTAGFGRDVDYVKSGLLELGARQTLGEVVVTDLSVYHEDRPRPYVLAFQQFPDPASPGSTFDAIALTSTDLGAASGLDARVERRGSIVTGSLAFSLLRIPSAGAGSPAFTTQALSALAMLHVPETWKAGTVWGTALANLSAVATFRLTSGIPYTRLVNAGRGIVAPAIDGGAPIEMINSSRLPMTKTLDLKVARTLRSRGMNWSVYADLRNLLSFENASSVYAETGTTSNDSYRTALEAPELSTLANEAMQNSALMPDGSVDLHSCATWKGDSGPVNCVALERVEARFGDGNGIYSAAEQRKALDAYYASFFGPWRFLGFGRTARLGVELRF